MPPVRKGVEPGPANGDEPAAGYCGDGGDAMALALERAGEHLAQRAVVVDQQDVQRRGGLHP